MRIDVSRKNDIVILKPHDWITGNAGKLFKQFIFAELPQNDCPPMLIIDFAGVARRDNAGLGTMMDAGIRIKQKGGRIGVINVDSHTKNMMPGLCLPQ